MNDLIGQTLGPYQIIEQIGEGGMATVFKAYQPSLDRYVAVKVLPPLYAKQPNFTERFEREAKAVANLNHPNILPVYEAGQDKGYSFIGMRYVENARTLKELMAQPLTLTQIGDLIGQIGSALGYAHQQGVLHRDVKPANVLMDSNWALLSDFGLAKMTKESVQLTGTGVGIGTPAYMSPEQGQGQKVDHRTDIYSLGIILFEMLTHQVPHRAETPIATIIKRTTEPMPIPRQLNPNIPEGVERVVLKTLARNPANRFDTAEKMAEALGQAVQETPDPYLLMMPPNDEPTIASDSNKQGTQPAPHSEPTAVSAPRAGSVWPQMVARQPRWRLVGVMALLVLIATGVIFSRGSGQQNIPNQQAQTPPQAALLVEMEGEIEVSPQDDPFALLLPEACTLDETPLYIEDFQDGKAQGWQGIMAGVDWNAQNGWAISSDEAGNLVVTASQTTGFADDNLQDHIFDNAVWRIKIKVVGRDADMFLNWRILATEPEDDTRYIVQLGGDVLIDLSRLQKPGPDHFSVGPTQYQMEQDRWYYFELSTYEGVTELWVDGQQLVSYTDPQPLPPGAIGLEVHVFEGSKTVFYFDDISVCGLVAPFTPMPMPDTTE